MRRIAFYPLLFLASALASRDASRRVKMFVVSNQTNSIVTPEPADLAKAVTIGPCMNLPREYPFLKCRHTEIAVSRTRFETERVCGLLLNEFAVDESASAVAYRGNQRWVRSYESIKLDESGEPIRALRPHGVYVFVGNLKGAGSEIARFLVHSLKARLAVIQESGMCDANTDLNFAKNSVPGSQPNGSLNRNRTSAEGLKQPEDDVMTIEARLDDEKEMRLAVQRVVAKYGTVHGVVWDRETLALNRIRTIGAHEYENSEEDFESCARSLAAMEAALEGLNLDWCVVLCSLASVIGNTRGSANAALDSFLEAYCANHNSTSSHQWSIVNWDLQGQVGALRQGTPDAG
ncbi:MAG: KR domain-containing protein, partial [Blastocatellia bacterium]